MRRDIDVAAKTVGNAQSVHTTVTEASQLTFLKRISRIVVPHKRRHQSPLNQVRSAAKFALKPEQYEKFDAFLQQISRLSDTAKWVGIGYYDAKGKKQVDCSFTPRRLVDLVCRVILRHEQSMYHVVSERIQTLYSTIQNEHGEGLCFAGVRNILVTFMALISPIKGIALIENLETWVMSHITTHFEKSLSKMDDIKQFQLIRDWIFAVSPVGDSEINRKFLDFLTHEAEPLAKELTSKLTEYGLNAEHYIKEVMALLSWSEDILPPPPTFSPAYLAINALRSCCSTLSFSRNPDPYQSALLDGLYVVNAKITSAEQLSDLDLEKIIFYNRNVQTFMRALEYRDVAISRRNNAIQEYIKQSLWFLKDGDANCNSELEHMLLHTEKQLSLLNKGKENEIIFIRDFFLNWNIDNIKKLLSEAKKIFKLEIALDDKMIQDWEEYLTLYQINRVLLHALMTPVNQWTQKFCSIVKLQLADTRIAKFKLLLDALVELYDATDKEQAIDRLMNTLRIREYYIDFINAHLPFFFIKTIECKNPISYLLPHFKNTLKSLLLENTDDFYEKLLYFLKSSSHCAQLFSHEASIKENNLHYLMRLLEYAVWQRNQNAVTKLSSIIKIIIEKTHSAHLEPLLTEHRVGENNFWILLSSIFLALKNKQESIAIELCDVLTLLTEKLPIRSLLLLLMPMENSQYPDDGKNSFWLLIKNSHLAIHNNLMKLANQLNDILLGILKKIPFQLFFPLLSASIEKDNPEKNTLLGLILDKKSWTEDNPEEITDQLKVILLTIFNILTIENLSHLLTITPDGKKIDDKKINDHLLNLIKCFKMIAIKNLGINTPEFHNAFIKLISLLENFKIEDTASDLQWIRDKVNRYQYNELNTEEQEKRETIAREGQEIRDRIAFQFFLRKEEVVKRSRKSINYETFNSAIFSPERMSNLGTLRPSKYRNTDETNYQHGVLVNFIKENGLAAILYPMINLHCWLVAHDNKEIPFFNFALTPPLPMNGNPKKKIRTELPRSSDHAEPCFVLNDDLARLLITCIESGTQLSLRVAELTQSDSNELIDLARFIEKRISQIDAASLTTLKEVFSQSISPIQSTALPFQLRR